MMDKALEAQEVQKQAQTAAQAGTTEREPAAERPERPERPETPRETRRDNRPEVASARERYTNTVKKGSSKPRVQHYSSDTEPVVATGNGAGDGFASRNGQTEAPTQLPRKKRNKR
jgi:hypothetical protein